MGNYPWALAGIVNGAEMACPVGMNATEAQAAGIGSQDDREWLVFIDESGDHSLSKVDSEFPVFVLSAVVVERAAYVGQVLPSMGELKVRLWGHEGVVLHSSEIRRSEGAFALLQVPAARAVFMESLSQLVADLPFHVFATVIDKRRLATGRAAPVYTRALESCIDLIARQGLVGARDSWQLVAESRGANEDGDLAGAYGGMSGAVRCPIGREWPRLRFAAKRGNVAGLQLADLCARPFGRRVINPDKGDRTFDLIERKLRKGWGAWREIGE